MIMKNVTLIILAIALTMFSCQKDEKNSEGTSRLSFRLIDAPGDYEEVNIDVTGLEVIVNDSVISLQVNEGVYNLLDFVNGKDTILVDEQVIPSGRLSQVRLILGDNNTVVIDGQTFELKTPSAQQSGLKFNIHEDFTGGVAYEYIIDFDAARSIVQTGNGMFILKPVIKVFTEAVSGAISGTVHPVAARPGIYAISEVNDSVSAFADTVTGKFMIRGLNEGFYKVSFVPAETYSDTVLTDVEVRNGLITKLDTLVFELNQ